jgi:hypothetical protein
MPSITPNSVITNITATIITATMQLTQLLRAMQSLNKPDCCHKSRTFRCGFFMSG